MWDWTKGDTDFHRGEGWVASQNSLGATLGSGAEEGEGENEEAGGTVSSQAPAQSWGKDTCVLAASVVSNFLRPCGQQPARPVHGMLQARILERWPCPFSRRLNPAIEPQSLTSPALAGGYFGATWEAWERIQALIKCQEPAEGQRAQTHP